MWWNQQDAKAKERGELPEFTEDALSELGIALSEWHAMNGAQRLRVMAEWFDSVARVAEVNDRSPAHAENNAAARRRSADRQLAGAQALDQILDPDETLRAYRRRGGCLDPELCPWPRGWCIEPFRCDAPRNLAPCHDAVYREAYEKTRAASESAEQRSAEFADRVRDIEARLTPEQREQIELWRARYRNRHDEATREQRERELAEIIGVHPRDLWERAVLAGRPLSEAVETARGEVMQARVHLGRGWLDYADHCLAEAVRRLGTVMERMLDETNE